MRPTKTALLTAAALASTSALTLPARAQVQGANFPQVTSPTMIGPPTATTFGGVLSNTPVTHQYVTGVNTSGVLTVAQPSASDITGLGALATENSLLCSQMPALTGGATTSAGACAVTLTPSSVASALSGQTISGLTSLSVGAETVTGAASIGGGMAGVGGFSFDNVTVSGAASVTGAANLGATTIHGAGSVTGGFAVAGTITGAAGAFTGGISAASATITSATTIQGALSVTGFTDTGTASITGAATISGVTLPGGGAIAMAGTLSGFTTATGSSLNLSGSATISGNQTVTGGASFGGTIGGFTTLSGGAINITGAETVGGALSVAGAATVTGAITAAGSSVIINGSGSVQKILEFTTSGVENWQFYEDATGSGSNLNVARYNSGGTLVDVPVSINFSTGNVGLSQGLNVGASATVNGSLQVGSAAAGANTLITGIQQANGYDTLLFARKTDTSPTGFFFRALNAAGSANEAYIDVAGNEYLAGNISVSGAAAAGGYLGTSINSSVAPTTVNGAAVLGWNYTNGGAETDFWNTSFGGFSFYQNNSGTVTLIASLNAGGQLALNSVNITTNASTIAGATFTNNAAVQYGSSFVLDASGNTSFNYLTTNGAGDLVIGTSGTVATGNFDVPGLLKVISGANITGGLTVATGGLQINGGNGAVFENSGNSGSNYIFTNGSGDFQLATAGSGVTGKLDLPNTLTISTGGASVAGGILATSGFITGTYAQITPAGSTLGTATAITTQNVLLLSASAAGVVLPSNAPAGTIFYVFNFSGNSQNVYPSTTSNWINNNSAFGTPVSIGNLASGLFMALGGGNFSEH